MPNPFLHTDLVWDPDLNFDGAMVAAESKKNGEQGLGVFGAAGFFPIGYIAANFPTECGPLCWKAPEYQKWLLGGQVGFDWASGNFDWRFGVSGYDFHNLQGTLSQPCPLYQGFKSCSSDQSRPAFMQKGNTVFALRQIVLDPSDPAETPEPQFVGLTYKYDLVNATQQFSYKIGRFDYLTLDLDYVRNLAFRAKDACRYAPFGLPLTNIEPSADGNIDPCDAPPSGQTKARLQSGPNGFYANLTVGDPAPRTTWAWNVSVGYKYLEPDAVPDAFTDSDFHLGGTNAKGFIVGASVGLFNNTWLTARWLSANEVSGPPLAIDVVQLDLNAGF
jgi:hypothetical protein